MTNHDSEKENDSHRYDYNEHLRFSLSTYNSGRSQNSDLVKETRFSGGSNYKRNERFSRTSQYSIPRTQDYENCRKSHESSRMSEEPHPHHHRDQKQSRESHMSKNSNRQSSTGESRHSDNTIALFGSNGRTGQYFLKYALEAGYRVRCLVLPGIPMDDMEGNENLTMVTGTLDDENKIHRVVRKAAYVVCMLNDCENTVRDQALRNVDFVQKLVPIVDKTPSCKVLLYQASSCASNADGITPVLSSVVKKVTVSKAMRENYREQDEIVKVISSKANPDSYRYIITRPSNLIWDRPSRSTLTASKSQPGPFPITNIDLAEFSLNALKMEKLYDSCPYVVHD